MKIKILCILFLMFGMIYSGYSQKSKKAQPLKLVTRIDSVSYGIGVIFGGNLIKQGLGDIDPNILAAAFIELKNKQTPVINEVKSNEIVNRYVMENRKLKTEKNLKEGEAFLEKNKAEPGVITLPSGLQYKIVKEGTGPKPLATDKVTVNYQGTFIDGKVFDSSIERGEPAQFPVNGVIEGWKEALQLMSVGSKWKLFVPAKLAYGEQQQQGSPIEPNTVLLFDVELISIDKEEPKAPDQFQPQVDLQDKTNK